MKRDIPLLLIGFALIVPTLFPLVTMRAYAFEFLWQDIPAEFASETGISARWPIHTLIAFLHLLPLTGVVCVGMAIGQLRRKNDTPDMSS